jgi:hypothetical protein
MGVARTGFSPAARFSRASVGGGMGWDEREYWLRGTEKEDIARLSAIAHHERWIEERTALCC